MWKIVPATRSADTLHVEDAMRAAAGEFLERALRLTKRGCITINNRFESFAPSTTAEIIRHLIEQDRKYLPIALSKDRRT